MICWTLGITEHHNAVDNVLALINLVAADRPRRAGTAAALNPLRGQNNVQGGGDMGALPDRLPGFQYVENDALRGEVRGRSGACAVPPKRGWHLSGMFEAMERGELHGALRHRREPGPVRGGPAPDRAAPARPRLPRRPGHLPDRDRRDRRRRAAGGRRRGPRPRARSRTPSGASSGCARRSTRRARRATTSGSSTSSRAGWAATGARPPPRRPGTRSARSRRCTPG